MAESDGPQRKRSNRECSYQRDWKTSGISASKRGTNLAHCDSCGTDIIVGHGGVHDIKKTLVKVTSSNQSLKALFRQSPIEQSVTRV